MKNTPIIDATGFALGITADGKLALFVESPNNPKFEIRFPLEAAPELLKGLQNAMSGHLRSH